MTDNGPDPLIVLLEDNALDAELIVRRLRSDGVALPVERATNERDYLQLLERAELALILSDFSLPSYDGLAALEQARFTCPHVPFIFVSGAIGEERAIETMRRGATDYVLKDRLERLGPAVKRALSESESRRLRASAESERDRLLISERQAREAAETANRMKDDFLAVVSHELRTPLNAILGWASLLQLGQVDEAKRQHGLEVISRNARMQARIIDDILDVSRIVSGKLELHRSRVTLGSFVSSAVDAVRPSAEAKDIHLAVELKNPDLELDADGERLQQVIWNLMTNAVKFTPAGGRIQVSDASSATHVQLSVRDTGSGIDAGLLPYVFEAFRQGDASSTRSHGGLGLGLAIVQHLVQLHGGHVTAQSAGLRQGSTFTVSLPLDTARDTLVSHVRATMKPAPISEPMAEVQPERLTGVHVLVVDDDAEARDILSELLRNSGARVTCAAGAIEALERVSETPPDILVSDIGMPELDGHGLIRKLRALPPRQGGTIPAIALTAYARDTDRRAAESAGFQRHLAKPTPPATLIATILELLEEQGQLAPAASTQDGSRTKRLSDPVT